MAILTSELREIPDDIVSSVNDPTEGFVEMRELPLEDSHTIETIQDWSDWAQEAYVLMRQRGCSAITIPREQFRVPDFHLHVEHNSFDKRSVVMIWRDLPSTQLPHIHRKVSIRGIRCQQWLSIFDEMDLGEVILDILNEPDGEKILDHMWDDREFGRRTKWSNQVARALAGFNAYREANTKIRTSPKICRLARMIQERAGMLVIDYAKVGCVAVWDGVWHAPHLNGDVTQWRLYSNLYPGTQ